MVRGKTAGHREEGLYLATRLQDIDSERGNLAGTRLSPHSGQCSKELMEVFLKKGNRHNHLVNRPFAKRYTEPWQKGQGVRGDDRQQSQEGNNLIEKDINSVDGDRETNGVGGKERRPGRPKERGSL